MSNDDSEVEVVGSGGSLEAMAWRSELSGS